MTTLAPISCGSCGFKFDPDAVKPLCTTCPASGGCGKARCPRCGWETTPPPRFVRRIRGWLAARDPEVVEEMESTQPQVALPEELMDPLQQGNCCGTVTLADMKPGDSAVIERFTQVAHVRKFLSMGVLPGVQVTVLRHTPAVVLRLGYSEFAFDQKLAKTVEVHRVVAG